VAARAENILKLVVDGYELLSLSGGFKSAHALLDSGLFANHERDLFSPSGRPVDPFGSIVEPLMAAMLDPGASSFRAAP